MRIVFVTQDDVFYLPPFFQRVLARWGSETAALVILPPARSWNRTLRQGWTLYGPAGFVWQGLRYVARKAGSRLGRWVPAWKTLTVEGVARQFGVRVLRPRSVNEPGFIGQLRREIRPDLVVSVAAPQIFGEELLRLPRLGCVNVHGALLPRYRGMLPSFWTLLRGEREGGVTVHYMAAGIDDGPIIAQRRFPIHPDDTVDSLIRRSKAVGAELLLEVLDQLRNGGVQARPNPVEAGSYCTFPSRADVRRLQALGRRVV